MPRTKPKKPAPLFVELTVDHRLLLERLARQDAAETGDPPSLSRTIRRLILAEAKRRDEGA